MQVDWLHFDLGDQQLELQFTVYTIIGVSGAAARDQLCSAMARTLGHADAGVSVGATLDDGSMVRVRRPRRHVERDCVEPPTGSRPNTGAGPLAQISSDLAAEPEMLVLNEGDFEGQLDSRLNPISRLRRSHRWAERLALMVALSLPIMCMAWLASLPLVVVSFLFILSLVAAFFWRFCGARLSWMEDRSVGEAIATRQAENQRLSCGERVPTIVNLPRCAHQRRRKQRMLDHLRPVSKTGQLIVVTDDAELVHLARSTSASVIESARAHGGSVQKARRL